MKNKPQPNGKTANKKTYIYKCTKEMGIQTNAES